MRRRAGLIGALAVTAVWLVASTAGAQTRPAACTSSCATLTVTGGSPNASGAVTIGVRYDQGPDDGQAGQGNDETAALAFTLGMPGGSPAASVPLSLATCDVDATGFPNAVHVDSGIQNNFRVVIENLQCGTARNHCLCLSTCASGATCLQDPYINVVVYGPKNLPTPGSGSVTIPVLPSGSLMTIDLHANAAGQTALHVFSEIDDPATSPKPQFGAYLSIGDQAAIDQTFVRDAGNQPTVSKVQIVNASIGAVCTGDCNNDHHVTVDELVKGVNIALGTEALSDCPQFDKSGDHKVTVDELVVGVNNALGGCSQ